MTDELKIANYILNKKIVCEKDLIFSYDCFIESEEYEKCGIINKLLKKKNFDNNMYSYSNEYKLIQNGRKRMNILLEDCKEKNLNDLVLSCKNVLLEYDDIEKGFWELIK